MSEKAAYVLARLCSSPFRRLCFFCFSFFFFLLDRVFAGVCVSVSVSVSE